MKKFSILATLIATCIIVAGCDPLDTGLCARIRIKIEFENNNYSDNPDVLVQVVSRSSYTSSSGKLTDMRGFTLHQRAYDSDLSMQGVKIPAGPAEIRVPEKIEGYVTDTPVVPIFPLCERELYIGIVYRSAEKKVE